MTTEEQEERLILFAVLQDIANELRRIKQERRTSENTQDQEQIQNHINGFEFTTKEK